MLCSDTNLSVGRVFGCSLPGYERYPFHWGNYIYHILALRDEGTSFCVSGFYWSLFYYHVKYEIYFSTTGVYVMGSCQESIEKIH